MDFDIVIVGAGLVGASFATALRGAGLKLALVEAQAPTTADSWDSRVYAISPGSAAFLNGLGVWKRLERERIGAVHEMLIRGDRADALLQFSAYASGVPELAWIVESSRLQSVLWQGLERQHKLELICPDRCEALQLRDEAAELTLASGKTLHARLVVAADGMHSWARQAAAIAVEQKSYGQMGVVANFACARAHHNTAYQWFREDGVLAYLPLPGQRMSMVWSTPDARAAELVSLPADAFCARVAEAGEDALGKLDLLSAPMQFPLARLRATRLAAPRIALIGDAGHVLHPLAGQGVNLGFGDAAVLAQVLLQRELFRDPGEIRLLRRYERARAEDILALAWVTDGLHRLFAARGGAAAKLRNTGLNLTNALPVLKNLLIRRALG
ncbi:MAG: UbiH/UbiF family hydroxylase [Betaproteobacteria bacterium]|nr:MAG: UbiH/UbiF family hydroxylase [Betaproteobacteria bacterium]